MLIQINIERREKETELAIFFFLNFFCHFFFGSKKKINKSKNLGKLPKI